MEVIVPGHAYKAANFDDPSTSQTIQFIQKDENGLIADGTTNEELMAILIDRLKTLQAKFPCRENSCAITHFEEGLMWLEKRTRDRITRGVEGKQQA
jgi:hypothetical protein